jgi:hypothetical protein
MPEPIQPQPQSEVAPVAPNPVAPNRARRRLLQGGLGASPLLMTLVSRPVLGQTQCFSPSAYSSLRTSQHGPAGTCAGRGPEYWAGSGSFDNWKHPYYPIERTGPNGRPWPPTLFSKVFSPVPAYIAADATLLDVLNMPAGLPIDVARYLIATVLNIQIGWVTATTVDAIRIMFREFVTNGYYAPAAGIKWYAPEILSWVDYTLIAG